MYVKYREHVYSGIVENEQAYYKQNSLCTHGLEKAWQNEVGSISRLCCRNNQQMMYREICPVYLQEKELPNTYIITHQLTLLCKHCITFLSMIVRAIQA